MRQRHYEVGIVPNFTIDSTGKLAFDPVTRGQMAAFMHRNATQLGPRAAFNSNTCWLEVNDAKVHGSNTHTTQEEVEDSGCTATGAQVVDAGTYTVDLEASGPDWYWDETM